MTSICRATTPLHTFTFEVDPFETYKRILISYAQDGKVVLNKTEADLFFEPPDETACGMTRWTASLRLTQEETNLFSADNKKPVTIQLRALTNADEAIASEMITVSVQDVLDDEVLV